MAIATTDIAINKGEHEEIVATSSMLRVGLCLWALDRPMDPAFVIQEMLEECHSSSNGEAIQYSAEAFSHAGKHQREENVILSALSNTIDQNSAWTENDIFDDMEALLSVYENWSTFEREDEKQTPMKTMR